MVTLKERKFAYSRKISFCHGNGSNST